MFLEAHRCLGLGWINGPRHRALTGECMEQVSLGLMTFGGLNACACVVLAVLILLFESVAEHRRRNRLGVAKDGKSVAHANKSYVFVKAGEDCRFFLINRMIAFVLNG